MKWKCYHTVTMTRSVFLHQGFFIYVYGNNAIFYHQNYSHETSLFCKDLHRRRTRKTIWSEVVTTWVSAEGQQLQTSSVSPCVSSYHFISDASTCEMDIWTIYISLDYPINQRSQCWSLKDVIYDCWPKCSGGKIFTGLQLKRRHLIIYLMTILLRTIKLRSFKVDLSVKPTTKQKAKSADQKPQNKQWIR